MTVATPIKPTMTNSVAWLSPLRGQGGRDRAQRADAIDAARTVSRLYKSGKPK